MTDAWVTIGRVRSVNPGRREVRIAVIPGHAHEFDHRDTLRVRAGRVEPVRCRLENLRDGGDLLIAAFAAGVPKDAVGAMRGAEIVLAPGETTRPSNDDLRAENLPGLMVRDEDGAVLGRVVEAYASAAHAVVCVERPGGGRFLLPVIEQVLVAVDFDARVLDVKDIGPHAVEAPD